jgi:hypothetical protein
MLLFDTLLVACTLVGCVLTFFVNSPLPERYASVELAIFGIDAAMLLIFTGLALRTDRYWPLWVAALQLLVVLAHLAKAADPEMLRNGYGFNMAFWSYPQLLAIALGTRAYRKNLPMSAAGAT